MLSSLAVWKKHPCAGSESVLGKQISGLSVTVKHPSSDPVLVGECDAYTGISLTLQFVEIILNCRRWHVLHMEL